MIFPIERKSRTVKMSSFSVKTKEKDKSMTSKTHVEKLYAEICYCAKLRKMIGCLVVATAVVGIRAEEKVATWKGTASDRFWNVPSNWAEGVVPGRYTTKDENNNTVTNGEYGWTARFSRSDAQWVVKTANLVSISNIVVTGDNATFQIGQHWETIPLEDGGGIYIEKSSTRDISLQSYIGIAGQKDVNAVYHIKNDSPCRLNIVYAFDGFKMDGVFGYPHMRFEGSGKTWLYGSFPNNSGFRPYLDMAMAEGGELHITNTVSRFRWIDVPAGLPKQNIVIEPGSILRTGVQPAVQQLSILSDIEISGLGAFQFNMSSGTLNIGAGATVTISAPASQYYTGVDAGFKTTGPGTLRFTGGNTIPQDIDIYKTTVEARTIGMAGEAGDIGLGNKIVIEQGGTLRYTGSGETTDRNIELGYYTNVIEQAGTGPVIFTGSVTSLNWNATLCLSNDTDEAATFAGPILAGHQNPIVRKRGTGEWILSGENTTTGMFYHEGGTLTVGSASSLPRLTVAGDGTLKIADGVTLTLSTSRFIYDSGTLDVVPGIGAKFIVTGAVHGPAPEWLTINGRPAKYRANGELAIANLGIVISFR